MASYGMGSTLKKMSPILGKAVHQNSAGISGSLSQGAAPVVGNFAKMLPFVSLGSQLLGTVGSAIESNQQIQTSNLDSDTATKLRQQTKNNISNAGNVITTVISALLMFLL